jgi:hypothetical protein
MWFASRDTKSLHWISYGKLHSLQTDLLLIFYSLRGRAFLCIFIKTKKTKDLEGEEKEWEELAQQVRALADDSDNESDDDLSLAGSIRLKSEPDSVNASDGEAVDIDFDADRCERDASLIDEFEDVLRCKTATNDVEALPELTIEDRKEACVLLSKVCTTYLYL